ncbi:MAG TPA: hypothetical protein VJ875_05755 [Pyrinomonadaceae bacterium]|nr:hypothetical protein [Pyrinomonadaceae bacterium]
MTILALIGVFLPVLVLTYMQYRSLTELENKTKGAFKDNLRQGLTIVEQQMKQRLEDVAAQTLDRLRRTTMNLIKNPGRRVGLLYLLLMAAPLRLIYIPAKLFVAGDAAATANNLATHETGEW